MDLSNISTLLLACLSVELKAEVYTCCTHLSPRAWVQLHELALAQRVSSLLWQRLAKHGLTDFIPAALREAMQTQYYEQVRENIRLYHELGIALRLLRAQKLPVLVLKGAHLGSVVYQNPALRLMNDVDLLFAQADIPGAAALLATLGYQSEEALLFDRHFATDHHLPRLSKPASAVSFELHWLITYPHKAYTIALADLWSRAQPVTVAGVEVLALCPEDLLLHICEHATYHHLLEQGIRFLCDLDAIVRHYSATLDWAAVQQRAQEWGWCRGVYLALILAQRLLATPIPSAVLSQLAPAELDDQLTAQALRQLFADQSEVETVSNAFAQMWGTTGWRQKMHLIGERFLAPTYIVQQYPVQPGSLKLYLYYPIRCKDLLVRYGHALWRLWRRDPLLTATTQSKQNLTAWLEQC